MTATPAPASPAATEMALAKAVAAYEALSPVDKALHDAEQRRSFVRGHSGHDPGPNVLAAEVIALRAERDRLREALAPFAEFAANVEARYRKRGGDPDSFPDTHPFADVTAADLTCGVWRAARAALAEGRADGELP